MPRDYGESNPFTPGFGEVLPHLAGRSDMLHSLHRAFGSGIRRPGHTLHITGARGTGETAMLSVAAEGAQSRGWIVVNEMMQLAYDLPRMREFIADREGAVPVSQDGVS